MPETKIIWYGHGTTKLITPGGRKILVDPFLTGNPACPPDARNDRDIDLLLVTHGHGDHFGDTITILKENTKCHVMCIFEMANFLMRKGVPQERVIGFNIGGSVELEGIVVTMTKALHSGTLYDGYEPVEVGPPVGFVVHLEDEKCIYFAGDTDIFSEMEFIGEFYHPYLAVLPIDGYYNMNPKTAAKAAQILKCEGILPVHHSTFPVLWGKPEMLKAELEKLNLQNVTVHTVNPGVAINL